jgi:glycerophosphoryl diester phosphodiesterase
LAEGGERQGMTTADDATSLSVRPGADGGAGAAPSPTWRVLCFGHRGARGHVPENTLLAFDLAFDLGADAIECDVQRSHDGQPVIIHDGTVDRTTNGSGPVSMLSFAELRALNAGRGATMPQSIPTLEETLDLVRRRGGQLNLEIKGESVEEAASTALAVEPYLRALEGDQGPRILVSSFAHPAVAVLKERLPWLRVGALFSGSEWRRQDMLAATQALGAEAIHPSVRLTNSALIQRAHAAGLRVNVWTANRRSTIARLIEWGVDGLFTDYPERVIIARAQLEAPLGRSAAE